MDGGEIGKISAVENGADFRTQPTVNTAECNACEIEALTATTFNVIDHHKLRDGQLKCEDVKAHRDGNHASGLNMQDFEFSPVVTLFCDLSNGKKARPLVPKPWWHLITR